MPILFSSNAGLFNWRNSVIDTSVWLAGFSISCLLTSGILLAKDELQPAATDTPAVAGFAPSPVDSKLPSGVDQETGFRMQRYRGAVPEYNPGTETTNTERAFELHSTDQVIFIDVFPPRGLGPDPIDGTWITNDTHNNIEGSTWLPEVGRGFLEQANIDYFSHNLMLLTNGNKEAPLLFYCTADCWQSWNAAQRALRWGYNTIFWYPDGTDGWLEQNHPLFPAEPINFFGKD